MTCVSDIHYSQSTQCPQLSPSLSLLVSCKVPACSKTNSSCTIRYFTDSVSITFAQSIQLQSYLHPLTSTSSWFLFVRTLSASSISFVHVFPIFFPCNQIRYECVFLFLASLSFTVAGTPKYQCLLCLCFCLLTQRRSGASTRL